MTEEALREAVAKLDMSRAQLDGLIKQSDLLRMSLEEHMRAKETITRYSQTTKGERLLVPIGANCFIFAAVESTEDVIMGLGSDVAVEQTAEGAISKLDQSIKQMNEAEEELSKRITELDSEVAQLSQQVQTMYEEYRSQA
ncbi:MAG: prefoldin subunit alpha [Thermoplasmata archaeon]